MSCVFQNDEPFVPGATAPKALRPNLEEEEESILITKTQQGEYSISLSLPSGQERPELTNQTEEPASHDNQNGEYIAVHGDDASTNHRTETVSHVTEISNHSLEYSFEERHTIGSDGSDGFQKQIDTQSFDRQVPVPRSPSQSSVDSQGKPVELIRVPADQITTVTEKKGSWFSSGKSSVSPKGVKPPASPSEQTEDAQTTDNNSDNVNPAPESPTVKEMDNSGIKIESQDNFVETTPATLSASEELEDQENSQRNSVEPSPSMVSPHTGQDNIVSTAKVSSAAASRIAGHQESIQSTRVETSSLQRQSVSVNEITRTETLPSKVLYPLKPVSSAPLSPVDTSRATTQVLSLESHSRHTEHHSQVEHIKKIIEHTEKTIIGDSPGTPDSSFNQSTDFLNLELEQLLREKAKLEGQVEVMAAELKIVIKERAELQSQLASIEQQLKSQESSSQGIVGDRDAMEAKLKTMRQNRARMELVVMDAQKLLEDKDVDIKTLQEDVGLAQEANNKLHDKIVNLNMQIQARDNTVEDLKSKVTELYVEYQTANQNKILGESEIQSLQGEIKSLKTGKEWYQDQLHLAQQNKSDLQKQVTGVKSEMILQGTFIEKLKADNARIKQQLTETQQRAIHEKEMLARHLEAIEADMMEREATFVQIQRERETMEHALQNHEPGGGERVPVEVAEDLRKAKSELRRKGAQVGVLEHEQAELLKRLTLSQESILERDRDFEILERKYVDMEVQFKQAQLDMESKEQEISRIRESKSAIEVELSSVKEEKKNFDTALQTLKDDMGKVEKSFKYMKQDLEAKKEELDTLKSEKQRTNEKIAELTRDEIRNEVVEEMRQRSELTVHEPAKKMATKDNNQSGRDAESDSAQDYSAIELGNLKSQNQLLEMQIQSLKSSNAEDIKVFQSEKKALEEKLDNLQEELLLLKSENQVDNEDKAAVETELASSKERLVELELGVQAITQDKLRLESDLAIAQERLVASTEKTEALAVTPSASDQEIQRVRDINTELRNKLADLQRESHKEIAKQKAKVSSRSRIKITIDANFTDRGKMAFL